MLAYPTSISGAAIRRLSLRGGVLIAEDVVAYAARVALRVNTVTQKGRRLQETLWRLIHEPLMEHRSSPLLELDTQLTPPGVLFRIAWQLWDDPPPHIRLSILASR